MKDTTRHIEVLGTKVSITLPTSFSSLFSSCFDELKRIERTYSRFLDASQLNRINANLDVWQEIDTEMYFLLENALAFQKDTKGYFSCTLKSELEAIGYDKEYSFMVKDLSIKKPSFFSSPSRSVQLRTRKPGQDSFSFLPWKKRLLETQSQKTIYEVKITKQLDFGGFGKGFAVDMVKNLLETNDVPRYFINAGGDIYAYSKDAERPWTIHLEHPDSQQHVIGKIKIAQGAIASSSPNRRSWKDKNKAKDAKEPTLHHLIDPKTGKPSKVTIKSLFVMADTCMQADAYATALFVAGYESACALARQLPIEIHLVSTENDIYMTDGFLLEEV